MQIKEVVMKTIRIAPAGDCALLVELEQRISEEINDKVRSLMKTLETAKITGILEMVPTYSSLLILYEPKKISYENLSKQIEMFYQRLEKGEEQKKRLFKIPCCYSSHFAPDLSDMEELTHLSKRDIISLHSGTNYRIYMLGFLPGFVYLGGLDPQINAPRLKTPRLKIPKGAVAIGGSQTGVYPLTSPGGWRIIGGTPIDFFDPQREEPVLCQAGDFIRFFPISGCDYYDIRQEILKGSYKIEIEEL